MASSPVDQDFLKKKNPKHPPSKAAGFADCSGLSSVTPPQPAAHRRVSLLFLIEGQNLEAAGNCYFFFFFFPRRTKNKTTLRKGRRPWRSRNGNPKGGQRSQEGFVSTTRGVIAAEPPVPLILKLNLLFPCVYEAHRVQAHSTSCAGELVLEGARRAELLGDTCGDLSCASKQR